MRYLWDLYPAYLNEWSRSRVRRIAMGAFSHHLRVWDYASAARVDEFIANSRNVQQRIFKSYRRESTVIYPPVAVDTFFCCAPEDYYLIVSELVAYKRVSDAVECFTRSGRKLRIAGDGPEYAALKKMAGPSVTFCGRVSDTELRRLYARSRAVLVPGEEDFGIVAVEALASGKPLIGLGRGGLLEVAPPAPSAFLYSEPGANSLQAAIERFEKYEPLISPGPSQAAAARFSEERFAAEMQAILFGAKPASHPAVLQKVHKSATPIFR